MSWWVFYCCAADVGAGGELDVYSWYVKAFRSIVSGEDIYAGMDEYLTEYAVDLALVLMGR